MTLFESWAFYSMQSPLSTVVPASREDRMSLSSEMDPAKVQCSVSVKGEQTDSGQAGIWAMETKVLDPELTDALAHSANIY